MAVPPLVLAAFSVFFLIFDTTGVAGRQNWDGTVGHTSSCGGSTPWKCPYIAYKKSPGCFKASITSSSECLAAAKALGYTGLSFVIINKDSAPPGCHVGDKTEQWETTISGLNSQATVYFNEHPSGKLYSANYRSICHNRVDVDGAVGIGRDFHHFHIGDGRGYKGTVENIRRSHKCCGECWTKYPGTMMFEYWRNRCTCLYQIYGKRKTLVTGSTTADGAHYPNQSSGICAPAPACFDNDQDYPGLDINLSTAATTDLKESAAECQALCSTNSRCKFFTWSSSNKRCYLKEGKSGVNYESGATSGPKNC